MGGWSHELWGVRRVLCQSLVTRPLLIQWLQRASLLESLHPLMRGLSTQRLVLLRKPNNQGIRPILIGMLPLKLIHSGVNRAISRATNHLLRDVQFGVGVANGTSQLVAHLLSQQQAMPETSYVRIDVQNAFGQLSRPALYRKIMDACPEAATSWGAFLCRTLARPLVVPCDDGTSEPLQIFEGVAP